MFAETFLNFKTKKHADSAYFLEQCEMHPMVLVNLSSNSPD